MLKQNFKTRRHVNIKSYCWAHSRASKQRNTAPIQSPKDIHLKNISHNDTIDQLKISNNDPNLSDEFENVLKHKKQDNNQTAKIQKMIEKILSIYATTLEFFKHNQHKLLNIIRNELFQRNYQSKNWMISLLQNRQSSACPFSLNTLQNQLGMLNQFLSEIYLTRKKKEISVIYDKIIDEERVIAKKTNMVDYQNIYSLLHVKSTNFTNIDFISNYQNICEKFGSQQVNVRPHYGVKAHLELCVQKIKKNFEKNRKQKYNRKYILESTSRNYN